MESTETPKPAAMLYAETSDRESFLYIIKILIVNNSGLGMTVHCNIHVLAHTGHHQVLIQNEYSQN